MTATALLSPEAIVEAASELPLPLSAQQAQALSAYAHLLLRWNATYNLTSIDTPEQVLTHHLLDSLAVVATLQRLYPMSARVLDVGTGAGLPGIPLAVVLPDWRFTLIDKVGKKTAFLTQVKVELGLKNVEVVHGRVETLTTHDYNVIISRAFSSLGDFVQLSHAALAPGGSWVAMKGALLEKDSTSLREDAQIEEVVKLRVPRLAAERHLVVLRANSTPPLHLSAS